MRNRLLIIFLLILTRQHLIAGGDSTWTLHAGILYSNISSDDSKVFAGLDLKAGYNLSKHWQGGLNVQILVLDDNTVSPYTLIGGGPYMRWMSTRLFMDIGGTITTGERKKETISMYMGRFSLGAKNKLAEQISFSPQIFIQYEYINGQKDSEIWRPGVLLSVEYHF